MYNLELLEYSEELIRLICDVEALNLRLIKSKASLQTCEVDLFKLCLFKFDRDVTFFTNRDTLIERSADPEFCDSIYTVVQEGVITFYDYEDNKLLSISFIQKIVE